MLFRKNMLKRKNAEQQKKLSTLASLIGNNSIVSRAEFTRLANDIRLIELNIKAFGYDLAQRLAQTLPIRTDTAARHVGLHSKGATQADIESDWAAHWASELKIPVVYHRKVWELTYVLQVMYEHGLLQEGRRGLVFGCGREPVPSYLASHGVQVTVTDLELQAAQQAGWVSTDQHLNALDAAFLPHLIDRETFDRLVEFQVADMNAIPATLRDYDFCWSICAMEHLGSIRHGLDFVENSLETLKPGGVAIHTMEFNVENDGPTFEDRSTSLFQRRHLEELAARLRQQGHWVADFDFFCGNRPMDNFIDLPPWPDVPPQDFIKHLESNHLKLGIAGFISTSFGIVVKKAG